MTSIIKKSTYKSELVGNNIFNVTWVGQINKYLLSELKCFKFVIYCIKMHYQ